MEINSNSIYKCLKEIGMAFHLQGYDYIVKALELISKDKTYLRALTTRLYPDIATQFNTKWTRVERAMRYAVENTVVNMSRDDTIRIFGRPVNETKPPYVSEFLAALYTYIKLS